MIQESDHSSKIAPVNKECEKEEGCALKRICALLNIWGSDDCKIERQSPYGNVFI